MRYHSSVIDSNNLKPGMDFNELPDSYVIFIAEDMDKELKGLPYVTARTYYEYPDKLIPMNDNRNYIIVNAEYRGDDDFGKLMNDFRAIEVDDIVFLELKEKVQYFKNTEKGREELNSQYYQDIREAQEKGEKKGVIITAKNLFKNGFEFKIVAQNCPSLNEEELIAIQNEVLNPV